MIVEYEALNRSGATVSDSMVVEEIAQVYAELKRRGLMPIRIGKGKKESSGAGLTKLLRIGDKANKADPRRAARKELPFFTTQMSIMLETGTQVAPALTAIEQQMTCPRWRILVGQLRQHVEEGGSLATGIAAYPKVFDPIYVSMISAGETSGKMSDILKQLAQFSRQADRIRSKIISAMIYPILLSVISGSVMMVLIFFVLPRFEAIFEEMNVDLPGSTKALMALSNAIRHHLLLTMLSLGAVVGGVIYWLRSVPGQRFRARNVLKLPIFGSLISSLINARIFRLIGLLIEANVSLLEALELTKSATNNYLYIDLVTKVHDNVLNGQPMYEEMLRSKLISPSISQMIRTGEENSQIGKVMTMLADYLDDRNETTVATLTSIMEPVILMVMGIIVGTIAISLVLPMFDLSQIS